MQAAAEHARQDEALRLRAQIAHLDRQRALGTMSTAFAHGLSQPLTAIQLNTHNVKMALATQSNRAIELTQILDDIQKISQRAMTLLGRTLGFAATVWSSIKSWRTSCKCHRSHAKQPHLRDHDSLNNDRRALLFAIHRHRHSACAMGICRHPFVTPKPKGLGVGISISRAIAEKNGGHLHIANAPNGGAYVTLDLPPLKASNRVNCAQSHASRHARFASPKDHSKPQPPSESFQ